MCVCIAALTVAFLQAATDRKIKFKLHQLPPRYRQLMQTQKQLLCLQQRKPLKILPIPLNQIKIKRTEKIPKIKRTVRIIRRTVTVQLLKKVKNPSRVQTTVLRIRKTVFFIKQFFKAEQKERCSADNAGQVQNRSRTVGKAKAG